MKHVKLQTINLKNHPTLNEHWLQDVIAEDPSMLGIGDVVLKDRERCHTRAGRLDLLLQDADGHGRYEVEIQQGSTDESHIIRTIEYWDIERRKYPQYDHTAVIVAEDITSRFLNVVGLFNGFIPIFEMARTFEPSTEMSYNKYYIGLWADGRPFNFVLCRPQKNALRLEVQLPQTEEVDALIESAELDVLDYDKRWGRYRFKLAESDLTQKADTLLQLMRLAHTGRK